MRLADIAEVLGCCKATASRVVRGVYDKESDLPARYAVLVRLVEDARRAAAPEALCRACPREDCAGCRIAEL